MPTIEIKKYGESGGEKSYKEAKQFEQYGS
jgi:hypothetical protein